MAEMHPAYRAYLHREGGLKLADDPNDRGGMTFGGIARRFHHDWRGWALIDRALEDRAPLPTTSLARLHEEFFLHNYWDAMTLGAVEDQTFAERLFDIGAGPPGLGRASVWLQEDLNVLNREQHLWEDLRVDGHCGPRTVAALNIATALPRSRACLLKLIMCDYGYHVKRLALRDPSQEGYMYGWLEQRV